MSLPPSLEAMMAEGSDERRRASMSIMSSLIDDAFRARTKVASGKGAACLRCFDTGLDCGRYCSCEVGAKLSYGGRRSLE